MSSLDKYLKRIYNAYSKVPYLRTFVSAKCFFAQPIKDLNLNHHLFYLAPPSSNEKTGSAKNTFSYKLYLHLITVMFTGVAYIS